MGGGRWEVGGGRWEVGGGRGESGDVLSWRALNNNGYDQKNEPTIFWPAEYTTKTKIKTNQKTNPNPKTKNKTKTNPPKKLSLGLGLVLFSFRFWLSVYSAGQKYRWLIFLVV